MDANLIEASKIIEKSFYTVLKINLTQNSCEVLRNKICQDNAKITKLTDWFLHFALNDNVHPVDFDLYCDYTKLDFLRDWFKNNEREFKFRYRQRIQNKFCWVMMEIFKSNNYSSENQECFLFVRDCNEEITKSFEQEQRMLDSLRAERICMAMVGEIVKSGLWTISFTEDGQISSAMMNDGFKAILAIKNEKDEITTMQQYLELIHPSMRDAERQKFLKYISEKNNDKKYEAEYRIKNANGSYIWLRMTGEVSRFSDGSPMNFLGVCLNITEQKLLQENLEAEQKQLRILRSIGEVYYTMHLINLVDDTVIEYKSFSEVREFVNKPTNVTQQMQEVMKHVVTKEYVESALEFTDLTTLPKRMKGKKLISQEFLGAVHGWIRGDFIRVEVNEKDEPTSVIFAVTGIDEMKRREENLVKISTMDELSGLYNRRAYDADIEEVNIVNLVVISMDLNGLKVANDNYGHDVGDEMIRGTAKCIRKCFKKVGKAYRMGGDEFLVLANIEPDHLERKMKTFQEDIENWHGALIDNISVSVGVVSSYEMPELSVSELLREADRRMYKQKSEYYKNNGHDRRNRS